MTRWRDSQTRLTSSGDFNNKFLISKPWLNDSSHNFNILRIFWSVECGQLWEWYYWCWILKYWQILNYFFLLDVCVSGQVLLMLSLIAILNNGPNLSTRPSLSSLDDIVSKIYLQHRTFDTFLAKSTDSTSSVLLSPQKTTSSLKYLWAALSKYFLVYNWAGNTCIIWLWIQIQRMQIWDIPIYLSQLSQIHSICWKLVSGPQIID